MDYFEVRVDRDGQCLERQSWFGDGESLERVCSELSATYPDATVVIAEPPVVR